MRISFFILLFVAVFGNALAIAQQEPTCLNPLIDLEPEQRVTLKTFVKWQPPNCPMVIETWRNGTDCKKVGVTDNKGSDSTKSQPCTEGLQDVGVHSGEVTIEQIRGNQKGRIEIKIWVPNKGIKKEVFVNVQ